MESPPKPIVWIATTKRDLAAMPEAVRKGIGFALWRAQEGKRHPHTKVLKGFEAQRFRARRPHSSRSACGWLKLCIRPG